MVAYAVSYSASMLAYLAVCGSSSIETVTDVLTDDALCTATTSRWKLRVHQLVVSGVTLDSRRCATKSRALNALTTRMSVASDADWIVHVIPEAKLNCSAVRHVVTHVLWF